MKKFIGFLLLIMILGAVLYGLQYNYHVFDEPLKQMNKSLAFFNKIINNQIITGISLGTALFILLLLIIPFFTKDINTKSYFKNIKQGVVSSFIFYLSQLISSYFKKIGQVYLLISIFGTMLITIILVQIGAKTFRNQEDAMEFRTGYIASITAGLVFSVLLQISTLGLNFIKTQTSSNSIDLHLFFK